MPLHDRVICGDSREVLKTLPDACADALVSDPPSGTHFMGLDFDHNRGGRDQWIAWLAGIMAEARRCIKPGGHALVWALPRTSHWTAMALEESGWTIRDSCHHIFATGFPKSRSCLKPAHETWWLAKAPGPLQPLQIDACRLPTGEYLGRPVGTPVNAYEWSKRPNPMAGQVTSEPAARWPPNLLLSHHPDCRPAGVRRVKGAGWRDTDVGPPDKIGGAVYSGGTLGARGTGHHTDADGYETVSAYHCVENCPVRLLDAQAGPRTSGGRTHTAGSTRPGLRGNTIVRPADHVVAPSVGNCSRFFPTFPGADPEPEDAVPYLYTPKASRRERDQGLKEGADGGVSVDHNTHPT